MLIESQGPSWFYGTGSEHSVLYQYQVSNAQNVSANPDNFENLINYAFKHWPYFALLVDFYFYCLLFIVYLF